MKRSISNIIYVLAFGVSLTALSLGGTAGCGSSAGGGGTTNATAAQQAQAAQIFSALGASASQNQGALALLQISEGSALKVQTISCTLGGTAVVSGSTFTYNACSFVQGVTITGTVSFVTSGSTTTLTYNNTTFSLDGCGDFAMTGTITFNSSTNEVVVDTAATQGGSVTNIDGTLTLETDDSISGDLDFTGAASVHCGFNHTNTDICPNTASACNLDASQICDGNDYVSFCAFVGQ